MTHIWTRKTVIIYKRTLLIIVTCLLLTVAWTARSPAEATYAPAPALVDHFVETAKLVAGDGEAQEQFGSAVDIDGDTLVVGTTYFSLLGSHTEPDAAYVFVRDGGAWTFQARLTASDGTPGDRFGHAVAIDGDAILVGAHLDDNGANEDQGAAYVFTRSGDAWTEQAQLTAGDGAAGDEFGWSVSLSGDTAFVGVNFRPEGGQPRQGAAYIFTRNGSAWSEEERLSASDGASGDQFGYAVAVSGWTALVGARGATIGGNILQGAAYVFTYDGDAWSEQIRLTASDGDTGDALGESVDFDGKTAVVGAPYSTLGGDFGRGAAYIFAGSGALWNEQAKLTASDYENHREFGRSVAMGGRSLPLLAGDYQQLKPLEREDS